MNMGIEDIPLYSFMNCFTRTVFAVTAGGTKCLSGEPFLPRQFLKAARCNSVTEGRANTNLCEEIRDFIKCTKLKGRRERKKMK